MNVLVVDDDRVIREGLRRTLANAYPAMNVFVAASAKEALLVLASDSVQLVVTDINMPDMNGLELLGIAKPMDASVVWVVMSAHGGVSYFSEAHRLGARHTLEKPIGKRKLIELIQAVHEETQVCDSLG